jgi:hypothetical protein
MKFLLILFPWYLYSIDYSNVVNDGTVYARGLLKQHKTHFDDNIIQPMTTGTEMSSVDGANKFTAQLSCSDELKANKFINVGYSGKNNISVGVNLDFNLDGSPDANLGFGGVSGVCADGIVKCSAGWDAAHCKYYHWIYSSGAKSLGIKEVSGDSVNSCYCTNNYCGNYAVSKKKSILDILLTGISQTISNVESQYVLTKTENNGAIATGYAQSSQECTQAHMGSQLGKSYDELKINALAESNYQQTSDANSTYNFMKGQQNNIVQNPIKTEANSFASEQGNYDQSLNSHLSTNPDDMKITSYGDGTFSDSAQLADIDIPADIEEYCKVRVRLDESIVYSDSQTMSTSMGTTQKYKIEVRKCENHTCFYDNSKEELKENCAETTNNFSEAVAQLTGINEASKDMVCSNK